MRAGPRKLMGVTKKRNGDPGTEGISFAKKRRRRKKDSAGKILISKEKEGNRVRKSRREGEENGVPGCRVGGAATGCCRAQ